MYHRAIFTVFILSFWQQLFIYLLNLNLFNSCDSQTVGLICFNLLIDFVASRKRAECDVPKTSISCHNIYLIISSILLRQHILPNNFIHGQQHQTTANSANLHLRLSSLQPVQPITLPNAGYSTHDLLCYTCMDECI